MQWRHSLGITNCQFMTCTSISIKLDVSLLIVSWFPFEVNLAKNSNVAARNCKRCNSICYIRANMVQHDEGYTEEVFFFSSADQRSSGEIIVLLIFSCHCGLPLSVNFCIKSLLFPSVFIGPFWILFLAEKQGIQSHPIAKQKTKQNKPNKQTNKQKQNKTKTTAEHQIWHFLF